MNRRDVDFMAMAEIGVHWPSVPSEDRIWERTKSWFEDRRLAVAYNSQDSRARRSQYGGTMIMAVNKMAHKVCKCGHDSLGRWAWMLIQGKHNMYTRIIAAYCPVRSRIQGGAGQSTVYAQQLRVLLKDPIEAFWHDLQQQLRIWVDAGENLIVSGDWNKNVVGEEIKGFMSCCGLKEAITYRHGSNPPSTYHRGSSSIDGIFVSRNFLGVDGGYLEYGDAPGDHRGLWIDIPQSTFLGYKMPNVPPKKIRHLQCKHSGSTAKYRKKVHEAFLKQNVYGRILAIHKTATTPLTQSQAQEYNSIDKVMTTIKKRNAVQCRVKRAGGRQWSDTLQEARDEINVWSLVSRRLKGHRIHTRTIIRAKKKTKIRNTKVPLEIAEEQLDRAHRHYKTVRKKDIEHREAFLNRLAEERAKEGRVAVATIIKNQTIQEQQRRTARRIRWTFKNNVRCGTTMIKVNRNGRVDDITDQDEMERMIIAENQKKYHQTEARCPLLRGQLLEDIGILGNGPAVEDILNGTYECPEGTSEATKLWLKTLHIPNRDTRTAPIQTLREYQQGWKKAREFTASGDLHFGHFKVEATQNMLSWANYIMAGIPRRTGFAPIRWKQGTDVMLLKKEGEFRVDKLRTIVLLESDFNQENKRIGREAMQLALEKQMITEEQYSRPGRSSQDNALNKRLFFDVQRQKKQNFGICACDLKSCYDRIVHNAAALTLRRVGMKEPDVTSMFQTIQKMKHTVRTAFGDSTRTYVANDPAYRLPVQGTCQGNGAGPSVWSILCSTIFEAIHSKGLGSEFCYALSRETFSLCGFAYVDDCELFTIGLSVDDVFEGLQEMLTLWDELMEVTGAAIAPDKCWWYLLEFQWRRGRCTITTPVGEFNLQVRNKTGQLESLPMLTENEANEMLGVYLAPSGLEQKQKEVMIEKAKKWGDSAVLGALRPFEIWTALNTGILKTLEYPIAATSLSKKDFRAILSPAIGPALSASGFSKSFPRAVLYSPVSIQGLGVQNLYHSQSCRHIKDILDQTWKKSPSEKYLRMTMDAFKLEAGILGPLFKYKGNIDWVDVPRLWIQETLQFCQKYSISFEEPGNYLCAKRRNDVAIMTSLKNTGFTTATLKAVNRCRLYLQVCTLADIADGNGRQLHPAVFSKAPFGRRNNYDWPSQGCPTRQDWVVWESTIRHCFQPQDYVRPRIGHWTLSQEDYVSDWDFFLTADDILIWRKSEREWWYCKERRNGRGRQRHYSTTPRRKATCPPRGTLWRTCVTLRDQTWITHGREFNLYPSITLNEETIDTPDFEWIGTNIRGIDQTTILQKLLTEDGLIAVSDGSYNKKLGLGSAAWIISSTCGKYRLSGGGLVPGHREIQSAYRSETAGILGIMIAIIKYLQNYRGQITIGCQITVGCDGKSALYTTMKRDRQSFTSAEASFDIVSRVIHLREKIVHTLHPLHIKGHQDEDGIILDIPAQLNVLMDLRAKEFIHAAERQRFTPPEALPRATYGIPTVVIGNKYISSYLDKTLKTTAALQDGKEWWIQKGRIRERTWDLIDWPIVQGTMKPASFYRRRFIVKWVTDTHPTGQRMCITKLQEHPTCWRCKSKETLEHVIRCPHRHNVKLWHQSIRSLDTKLRKIGTDPDIIRTFTLYLLKWFAGENVTAFCPRHVKRSIKRTCRVQGQIGWDQFFSGLWSKSWAQCQEDYFKSKKKRNTGKRWGIKVSNYLWDIKKVHWDHRNSYRYRGEGKETAQGKAELIYACQIELDFGMMELEDIYQCYFDTDIEELEEERTQDIISWLFTIRKAREESGFDYHNHDRISDSLRRWVGLSMEKKYRKDM